MKRILKFGMVIVPWCILLLSGTNGYSQPLFPKTTMVSETCSACHKPDAQGRLEVIEETRKTPEEWKNVVDRMIRVNGAPLEDAHFHQTIKELSRNLCLSPDEMAKIAYINSDENSQYREIPQNELEGQMYLSCVRCHTWGKIASHRNTKRQWEEIRNLHLGYYPTIILQMRQMDWAQISKELIEPLSTLFPFDAPQWRQWLANRKDTDISGSWVVAGYQPGMGYYAGTYTFTADPDKGEDEYVVERVVQYQNGTPHKTSGTATLFSEYHLRYELAPTPMTGRIEGVFDLNPKDAAFSGKWWTLVQDTNGYGNETFIRSNQPARLVSVFPEAMKASGKDQTLTMIGANLPEGLMPKDIGFSDENISVSSIERLGPSKVACHVRVGKKAKTGIAPITVNGIKSDHKIKIYPQIDAIKILPALGRARVSSGAAYPPHGVQFVARGISYGADQKPDTADDLVLEPVEAAWRLEEQVTREHDDDLKYLKTSITNGLYTPVTTYGPIEERHMRKEGTGLIAVVAEFTEEGRKLAARARLAVTVPDFITHIK